MNEVIDLEWHRSTSAQEYLNSLIHRGKRKQFGLLERPSLPLSVEINVIDYKIFVCGKSGVGKTSTVAKLAGTTIPKMFSETAGIEITTIYWPVFIRANGKVLFFRLNFWDVGDNAIKKFEHILPACQADADCYLFSFSFTDRASFEDIPYLIPRMCGDDGVETTDKPAHVILGTKADQFMHSDITQEEIKDLSQRWRVPVLRIQNVDYRKSPADELFEIAPVLNTISERLWLRDHSRVKVKTSRKKSPQV